MKSEGVIRCKREKLKPQAYFKYKAYDNKAQVRTQKWGLEPGSPPPKWKLKKTQLLLKILKEKVYVIYPSKEISQ